MKQYYGQHGEDQYIESFFGEDYVGTCVEVGAYNGVDMSNTYFFEKKGWKTLCIEANPVEFQKCSTVREQCIQCAVSDTDLPDDQAFQVYYINDTTSGVSSLVPDPRLVHQLESIIEKQETIHVPVRTLTTILQENNFPTDIDFISIDTEGTEAEVLRGIDFSIYHPRMLVVENNFQDRDCETYLSQYGYKRVHRLNVNDFFVRND